MTKHSLKPSPSSAAERPVLTPAKKRIFTTILLLFPLLLLLLLEGSLRLFGYGGEQSLFISAPPPFSQMMMINPQIARRYFSGKENIPTPSRDCFLKVKPDNCRRIFVLGGSTAAGFPYERNLRFSRILECSLQQAFPDQLIEVVNLAMSAVNSYTLLDFMEELLLQQPDMILLYAGHNEYYGALGVASRESLGRRRAWVLTALQLRRMRTYLLVRDAVNRIRQWGREPITPQNATLMERVVGRQEIPLDGSLYRAGIAQFEKNLHAILSKAQKKGVPLILSDLVCNVKDMPPFISLEKPESAQGVYDQARQAEIEGAYERAKEGYRRAKELDALRFRAPEAINKVIRRLAIEFNAPLVRMEERFEATSAFGLIGDNLMIDHLHPNIEGYFLMADAFQDALLRQPLFAQEQIGTALPINRENFSWVYTPVDSVYGALVIRTLKAGWPFSESTLADAFVPQNTIEELALRAEKFKNYNLRTAHETLASAYEQSGEWEKALAEYRALAAYKPLSLAPYLKAAELLNRWKRYSSTPALLAPALYQEQSGYAHILLGQAFTGMQKFEQALAHFEQARKLLGDDPLLAQQWSLFKQAQSNAAAPHGQEAEVTDLASPSVNVVQVSAQVTAKMQRAQQLIRQHSYDQALPILQQVVEIENLPLAHLWLGQIYLDRQESVNAIRHLEIARVGMPGRPSLLYNLSIAYAQSGDFTSARKVFGELERVQPEFPDSYRLEEVIR